MLRPILAACVVLCAVASAQEAPQEPVQQPYTFSVKSRLVSLPVVVRDGKGDLVQSLTKDDFQLTEDGEPQTIRYFELEKDRPLTLGLLVDNSGSVKNFVKQKHDASNIFFNAMLQKPGDTAFLVRFDDAVSLLQKPTGSRQELHDALETVEQPHPPQPAFRVPPNTPPPTRPAGTLLYDAIVVVCDKVTRQQEGRKAIVILSDGEDWGSQKSLPAAIEAAQRTDTVIYTILYTNRGGGKDGLHFANAPHLDITKNRISSGADVMEVLASTTGGHAYEVTRSMPLETIYTNIAEEMRMQYTMAYVPKKPGKGYRRIELKSPIKGVQIQTRFGYYAKD